MKMILLLNLKGDTMNIKIGSWRFGLTKSFSWKCYITDTDIYELDPEYNLWCFHWLWFWATKILF